MGEPVKVLIVEDSEDDCLLLVGELYQQGFDPQWKRVQTGSAMKGSLEQRDWDLVVSDFKMPKFDAPGALRVLQESGQDLPFIVISGTIGEELAVETMRAGAHDYLMKGNLKRLGEAMRRELREVEVRRQARNAEEARRQAEERFRQFFENAPDYCCMVSSEGRIVDANPAALQVLGRKKEELLGEPLATLYAPESHGRLEELFERWKESGKLENEETVIVAGDGSRRTVLLSASKVCDDEGRTLHSVSVQRDITDRRRTEERLRDRTLELGERVKELRCLYAVSRAMADPQALPDDIVRGVIAAIPPAFRYPNAECGPYL
ncbi:PAS domain S-box protein [Planctomycetota bacterium]